MVQWRFLPIFLLIWQKYFFWFTATAFPHLNKRSILAKTWKLFVDFYFHKSASKCEIVDVQPLPSYFQMQSNFGLQLMKENSEQFASIILPLESQTRPFLMSNRHIRWVKIQKDLSSSPKDEDGDDGIYFQIRGGWSRNCTPLVFILGPIISKESWVNSPEEEMSIRCCHGLQCTP